VTQFLRDETTRLPEAQTNLECARKINEDLLSQEREIVLKINTLYDEALREENMDVSIDEGLQKMYDDNDNYQDYDDHTDK
jgi:hypothetical protein